MTVESLFSGNDAGEADRGESPVGDTYETARTFD